MKGKENHQRKNKIKKLTRVREELNRLNELPPELRLAKARKISLFTNMINKLEEELG